MPDFTVSEFGGVVTAIKDLKTLKPGVSPDSLNWLTGKYKDHIELRRGYARLGATEETGNGHVSGLGVSRRYDGQDVLHFSYDRKIKYYDQATDDMAEVGSDILPGTANGEDIWFRSYQNLAGSFQFFGSPNSSVYKIPAANPGNAIDQSVSNYRWGVLHFAQGRAFAGQRNGIASGNNDKTGLYLSAIDKDQVSDFTAVTNEAVGASGSSAYSGTLAAITAPRTAMYPIFSGAIGTPVNISNVGSQPNAAIETATPHGLAVGDRVTFASVGGMVELNNNTYEVKTVESTSIFRLAIDSSAYASYTSGGTITKAEQFLDDRNGGLRSNLGSTGTINYATGAYSLTFSANTTGSVTVSYYHETATNGGVLDFTVGSNGLGKTFRQDDGGGRLMAIFNINSTHYPFHELKTWQVDIPIEDTGSTNLPYRNIGVPYERAAWQTPEGIIFADLSREADPKFRRLEVLQGTNINTIEPTSISDELDLTGHAFTKCVAFRWGDYEIFCVQEKTNGVANDFNSVMYVRNVVSGTWDKLNYYASCLAEYQGTLVAGDSISRNIYTLFSGFDEDTDTIENYWTSGDLNLKTDNLKTCRRMVVEGLIQPDQRLKISVSYDGKPFSEMFIVEGNGDYVDTGVETSIGSPTIGSKTIGSGGAATASPFEVDFKLAADRFINARIRIEALGIGYVSVNSFTFKDIRDKGRKNLPTRTR
jgi:hypothetical protein